MNQLIVFTHRAPALIAAVGERASYRFFEFFTQYHIDDGAEIMSHDRRAEFGFDPKKLLEKYCPVCGELRPVRTERDADGTKRHFCAKCQAPLGEEAADSFDKPEPGFPDA